MPTNFLGFDLSTFSTTTWIIGVVALVVVVILLIVIISNGSKRKQAKQIRQALPTPQAAPAPAAAVAAAGISAQTVAAIMAAVCAASGQPLSGLRFTAIRRLSGVNNPWSASGTADIIASRQAYL